MAFRIAGRGMTLAAAMMLTTAGAVAAQDRFDTGAGADTATTRGTDRTGEALWPVPLRQQWGQVVTQAGRNIWKDAIFTDPEGRWQLVYPATLTEEFGDTMGRSRMFRYPGQPQISCAATLFPGVFGDLGADAAVQAPAALASRRDSLIEQVRDPGVPVTNVQLIALAGPQGAAGAPAQAIMFDQRGKLLELLGVDREVVQRSLLVSDDDDLLHVSCTAQPGQKGWVEKQTPLALRLTALAREARR